MHRRVAGDLREDKPAPTTLEIGAGTLNQLRYEPTVTCYDVVEPFHALHTDVADRGRIRHFYDDIGELPSSARYQRITSIATFEHICDLPTVIALAAQHLEPQGVLRVAIPSEGHLLWTLGWRLTTGLDFYLRYGLDYGVLMRHEHVNSASEIESLLRLAFKQVSSEFYGISRACSFYQFFECRSPDPVGVNALLVG
ncbi:MAG: methyltransferase domain-containing protein [Pseudomonadota bacterium]